MKLEGSLLSVVHSQGEALLLALVQPYKLGTAEERFQKGRILPGVLPVARRGGTRHMAKPWRPAVATIVCHELLHVARRDWVWTLLEEGVQTIFWFDPAMWWALGEVQLSREEAVDEQVVAANGARQAYMSALLLFADAGLAMPAAIPYVRRRQLASRD